MGYGERWRGWIQGCLKLARASVLVNGSPTKEFEMGKSVRQGDPLSTYLFITIMEGLNTTMNTTCEKGLFKGIKIPHDDILLSHIFYVDNTLFIGEMSKENIKNLSRILRCFHVSSGLKVNFHKS